MEHPPSFDDGRPIFDHSFAEKLVGKYVLVGLTYVDRRGKMKEQIQFHGVVERADAYEGILLSLRGNRKGEKYNLPPHTDVFSPASPGEYSLRGSGEIVNDPDYTCTWTIEQPDA